MEIISLTNEERTKFAAYLRQEATVNAGLAKQLKENCLPNMGSLAIMAQQKLNLASAQAIVAIDLLSVEIQTIGGK